MNTGERRSRDQKCFALEEGSLTNTVSFCKIRCNRQQLDAVCTRMPINLVIKHKGYNVTGALHVMLIWCLGGEKNGGI